MHVPLQWRVTGGRGCHGVPAVGRVVRARRVDSASVTTLRPPSTARGAMARTLRRRSVRKDPVLVRPAVVAWWKSQIPNEYHYEYDMYVIDGRKK